jgi:CelD/BcsL family acetyltransferase involved in cellulose biosynthesis
MKNRTKTTLHRLESEEDYEAEIAKCAGVTGYHRWFVLDAIARVLELRFEAFAVEVNGETIGVFPVLLRRRGLISAANDLSIPHVGPLLRDPSHLGDVLSAADSYLRRQRAVVTKWRFAPGSNVAPEVVTAFGFLVSPEEHFVVPADRSPADHLAAMKRGQRQELRLAESRGLHARAAHIPEIADWFADRVGDAYHRQGIDSEYSRSAARQLVDLLGRDHRMLWRSLHDASEQIVAVTVGIIDVERLCGWMLIGDHNHRPSPHAMAYWDSIQWSLSHGLSCDFGGAPNEGIRNFKIRMGGVSEQGFRGERVSPAAYRNLRALYGRITQG